MCGAELSSVLVVGMWMGVVGMEETADESVMTSSLRVEIPISTIGEVTEAETLSKEIDNILASVTPKLSHATQKFSSL